jgi:hypothetical protein
MATFIILLKLDDDDISDVTQVANDLDKAINEHGLLGGNFIVERNDDVDFDAEWKRRLFPVRQGGSKIS